MPLAFNPMDPVAGNCSRRITSKRLAGNLLSIALGISLGILFLSLLLDPAQSDAIQRRLDTSTVPLSRRSIVSAPAPTEQQETIDEVQSAATRTLKQISNEAAAYRPDTLQTGRPPGGMRRLPGHVLPALANATEDMSADRQAEAAEGSRPLTLTIVLKRDDPAGFARYLHNLYDPHSTNFRKFLKQAEISSKFGPSPRTYRRMLRYFRARGFRLVRGSRNRLTLTVQGSQSAAERAFDVRIADYRLGARKFFANNTDPALPLDLGGHVQSIVGLSNFPKPQAAHQAIAEAYAIIFCGFYEISAFISETEPPLTYGQCITTIKYYLNGLHLPNALPLVERAGPSTPSQTIGLVEFDTFRTSDVADYLALIGLPANTISQLSQVHVNGGAPTGPNQDEVLLDIDTTLTLAPFARTVVYEAPFTSPGASFQTLLNAMIDGGVNVISNSWAYCENQTTAADVESIDVILQTAAASGITVVSGSGDTGSTCLDGSVNTAAVPADSPNLTAVGGTLATAGPGLTYDGEKWWNGTAETPPTGQGGFGVSKFFSRPSYQNGLSSSPMRSIPDVVINADPHNGVVLCDAAGCPNGTLNGGTSLAAPVWASFVAILNEAQGKNLGALNPRLYPLANTDAFHNAASIGSDFAHVGLGSPNMNALDLELLGQTPGTPSATSSTVSLFAQIPASGDLSSTVPADGKTQGFVVVTLWDAKGNTVSGKNVTLASNPGSSALIKPANGITSTDNGSVIFSVTDLKAEKTTFTATDTTEGVVLERTTQIPFVTPPATAAGLDAFPASVAADGVTNAVITVTLKDSLGRPSPGKLVSISQGSGHSVITGPIPSVTNAGGQVGFTAVDQVAESVTYSAVDVTDGNVPFPTTGTVDFTGGPANGCGNSAPPAAPGFLVTPYATGFIARNYSFGDVDFTCAGAYGMAFDATGNLYVSYGPTGDIYKFKPGGGVADATTLLTTTALGPSLAGLAFDTKGNLFASRDATTGNFFTGAVFQIDPSNGTILSTVASDLTCPTALSVDPLSGDLFTDDSCSGAGSDNPDLWRIADPDGAPKTAVYTTLLGTPNANISFAPSGTIYAWAFSGLDGAGVPRVAQISGTDGPVTPTVSLLPNIQLAQLGMLAMGKQANGDAQYLFLNPFDPTTQTSLGIGTADLTTNPPRTGVTLATGSGAGNLITGPDGCVYAAAGDGVFKITDATGACNYAAPSQPPSLVLAPPTVAPNPAQGTSQTLTASFHYVNAPAGTPVFFRITGANPRIQMVRSDANGQAPLSYTALFPGIDTIVAASTFGTTKLTSNKR